MVTYLLGCNLMCLGEFNVFQGRYLVAIRVTAVGQGPESVLERYETGTVLNSTRDPGSVLPGINTTFLAKGSSC